jgi:hypothetical protein
MPAGLVKTITMSISDPIEQDNGEIPPPPGAPSPALQEFNGAFSNPVAKEWAGEVTTRLNDYFQRRDIADDAAQAGQAFVDDIGQFKSGLVNMVKSDPNAVHTALDIVPPTVAALVTTLPGQVANAQEHHDFLTGDMQHEIAAAAVTAAAEHHEDLARGMLADERISSILGDSVRPLETYVGMQAAARERDAAAQRGQAAVAAVRTADLAARNYVGDLVGPDGNPRSPDGWNQAVIADLRVPPDIKMELFGIHDRLGTGGDQPTDPLVAADVIHRAANGQVGQRDIYPMIGRNMSMADAGLLTAALRDPSYLQALDSTIQIAQQRIAPHGDVAETRAFGRFVDWLMPQVHRGAVLDPRSKDYVLANTPDFRVQGSDLPRASLQNERPTLQQIFGGGNNPPGRWAENNWRGPNASQGGNLMPGRPSRDEFGQPRDAEMLIEPRSGYPKGSDLGIDPTMEIQPSGTGPRKPASERPPRNFRR